MWFQVRVGVGSRGYGFRGVVLGKERGVVSEGCGFGKERGVVSEGCGF